MVETKEIHISTHGNTDIIDITPQVESALQNTNITKGIVNIFVPGATGGVTTIEYEPGLMRDFPELMEKLIPSTKSYHHNNTWHDGNGHSHLRASLLGPSLCVPFNQKKLILGTWQQIIFVDFDIRSRSRRIILQIVGD